MFSQRFQIRDCLTGPTDDTKKKLEMPDPESILEQLRARTPLIKAMLTPTLTEEEVKEALGEDKVLQTIQDFFFFNILNVFKDSNTWTKVLFNKANDIALEATKVEFNGTSTKFSLQTPEVKTNVFPKNSKAPFMTPHPLIPGLFLEKKNKKTKKVTSNKQNSKGP